MKKKYVGNRKRNNAYSKNKADGSALRREIPLITLQGYALSPEEIRRMSLRVNQSLIEIRKELGL